MKLVVDVDLAPKWVELLATRGIVAIPEGQGVTGLVMVEQLRSLDFCARSAKRIGVASEQVLQESLALLDACIY